MKFFGQSVQVAREIFTARGLQMPRVRQSASNSPRTQPRVMPPLWSRDFQVSAERCRGESHPSPPSLLCPFNPPIWNQMLGGVNPLPPYHASLYPFIIFPPLWSLSFFVANRRSYFFTSHDQLLTHYVNLISIFSLAFVRPAVREWRWELLVCLWFLLHDSPRSPTLRKTYVLRRHCGESVWPEILVRLDSVFLLSEGFP